MMDLWTWAEREKNKVSVPITHIQSNELEVAFSDFMSQEGITIQSGKRQDTLIIQKDLIPRMAWHIEATYDLSGGIEVHPSTTKSMRSLAAKLKTINPTPAY